MNSETLITERRWLLFIKVTQVKEVKDTKVAVKKKDEEEEEEEKEITTKGEGSVLDSGKDVVDLVWLSSQFWSLTSFSFPGERMPKGAR